MPTDALSQTFAALADPTRRAILARLSAGEASVNELAKPFPMSLPGISKHLKVLEKAGLIARGRQAQWRPCRLEGRRLKEVVDWADQFRRFWDASLDRLDDFLHELQTEEQTMSERQVEIIREFAAPRELVFRAWIEPQRLMQWYAPHGCSITFRTLDPQPGGAFHSCIRTPTGYECWCVGDYREVIAPERIVYTMAIANEQGERVAPTSIGMDPAWPAETLVTVTFEDLGGKRTKLTLRQTVSESLAKQTGAHPSWLQMLDRLADELAAASG